MMKIREVAKEFNEVLEKYRNTDIDYKGSMANMRLMQDVMEQLEPLRKKYSFEVINGVCYRVKSADAFSTLQFRVDIDLTLDKRYSYPNYKGRVNKVAFNIHQDVLEKLEKSEEDILDMTFSELEYRLSRIEIISSMSWAENRVKKHEYEVIKWKNEKEKNERKLKELEEEYAQKSK